MAVGHCSLLVISITSLFDLDSGTRKSDYQCHCGYHGITSVTIASKFLPLFCQFFHSTILPMTLVKY